MDKFGYILMFSIIDYQGFLDTISRFKYVNKLKKPYVI